jgi:2-methylisocitrate lyase-like PEP mutase family enzyme
MFQGGKTPLLPTRRLAELGYQLVIIPSDLQRAAIAAMRRALHCIAADGSTAAMAGDMVTFKEREAVIGTDGYQELDRRFGA